MHDPYVSVGSLIPPYSMHRKNGNDEENMKVAALQRVGYLLFWHSPPDTQLEMDGGKKVHNSHNVKVAKSALNG